MFPMLLNIRHEIKVSALSMESVSPLIPLMVFVDIDISLMSVPNYGPC